MSVKIIAEAGVNHNGDIEIAKELVRVAAKAGADIVKFQSFSAGASISKFADKALYQKRNDLSQDTQLEMVAKLELNASEHAELVKTSRECGIEFMSTAFDSDSMRMLHELNAAKYLKIPSGEVTNLPLIEQLAGYSFEHIFLSTGMANLGEIEQVLDLLLARGAIRENITLLHCTTEYPAPVEEINLNAMLTLEKAFQLKVGLSDHSEGIEVALAAVALGATVIEKHFTLDRNMAGPDHLASIEPKTLKELVNAVRKVELALGSPLKKATKSEKLNMLVARKSVVAKSAICIGDVFTTENITTKRPGDGIPANQFDIVLGCVSRFNFEADEQIRL